MRRHLRSPLARWGFLTLALLAASHGLTAATVVAGGLALAAWHAHTHTR